MGSACTARRLKFKINNLELVLVLFRAGVEDQPDEGLGEGVEPSTGRHTGDDLRPGVEEDGDDDVAAVGLHREDVEQKLTSSDFVA